MTLYQEALQIARSRDVEGVLIDTNLLLFFSLAIMEKKDRDVVQKKFSFADISVNEETVSGFLALVKSFKAIYVTPYILAEFSNLTMKFLKEYPPYRKKYFEVFIEQLTNQTIHEEQTLLSGFDVNLKLINDFGFTDVHLITLAVNNKLVVLTIDGPLTALGEYNKTPVFNFTQMIYDDVPLRF